MPRRVFEFKCEDGHISQQFTYDDVEEINCKECGKQAWRIISPVRSKLDPVKGDFPGATMKWAKEHERAAAKK